MEHEWTIVFCRGRKTMKKKAKVRMHKIRKRRKD